MQTAVAKFGADLTAMERRSATMAQRMEAGFTGVTSSVNRFLGVIGVAGGVAGIGLLVQRSLSAIDALDEQATRIGLNVEALQELQHAARMSGASVEQFETAMGQFQRRIGEVVAGEKESVDFFREIGLSVTDAGGRVRSTQDILGDFADTLAATANPAERTRMVMEAFGRSGTLLLPMLEKGRAGLSEFQAEARRLGLVMDADMVKKAGEAADRLSTIATIISTNLTTAIGEFVASDTFGKWIERIVRGLGQLKRGAKDLGLFPSSQTEDMERLRKQAENLEAQAKRIEESTLPGDAMNRFFGWPQRYRDQAAEIRRQMENMAESPFRGTTPRAAVDAARARQTAEEQKAIDALLKEGAKDRLTSIDAEKAAYEELLTAEAAIVTKQRALEEAQIEAHLTGTFAAIDAEVAAYEEKLTAIAGFVTAQRALEEAQRQEHLQGTFDAIDAEIAAYEEELLALAKILDDQLKAEEDARKKFETSLLALQHPLAGAFEDAIIEGKKLSDVMESLGQDVLRLALRWAVLKAIQGAASGIAGLFPTGGGGADVMVEAQHGAHLGARQPAIVGEAGPEIWWPDVAGRIIPNHGTGGGIGGDGGVQIQIINQAPGVRVRSGGSSRGPDGRAIHRFIVEHVNSAVAGGEIDGSMGRRFGASPRV